MQPEYLTAAEIGYKNWSNQNYTWFANIFYNYYNDMIDFVYSIPVDSLNRTNVEGYGFELGGDFDLPFNIAKIEISYSLIQMGGLDSQMIVMHGIIYQYPQPLLLVQQYLDFGMT